MHKSCAVRLIISSPSAAPRATPSRPQRPPRPSSWVGACRTAGSSSTGLSTKGAYREELVAHLGHCDIFRRRHVCQARVVADVRGIAVTMDVGGPVPSRVTEGENAIWSCQRGRSPRSSRTDAPSGAASRLLFIIIICIYFGERAYDRHWKARDFLSALATR